MCSPQSCIKKRRCELIRWIDLHTAFRQSYISLVIESSLLEAVGQSLHIKHAADIVFCFVFFC